MPKDTEKHLMSCGLKNALYSIRASDITEELFGSLVPCPFQVRWSIFFLILLFGNISLSRWLKLVGAV